MPRPCRAHALITMAALVAALVLCLVTTARAQFVLTDAFSTAPLGPESAKGAVIWNHGKPPLRGAEGDMLPFYLDRLRDAGWDVLRLDRDWSSDNLALSPAALREQVDAVYRRGYRKVVLAGQSYGAWISLLVAASGPPIHAVIATAPAAFGRYPESRIFRRNAEELYPILERIRNTRVMMFLFEGDAYDTGDRGAPAETILARNAVDHAVVAYPHGWIGHGAANWNGFATRFGPCIERFVDPARSAADADCAQDPVTRDALRIALPKTLRVAGGGSADALAGLWYGVYRNGREALVALDGSAGEKVEALYAWGIQQRDEPGAPGYDRRIGRVDGDGLLFSEPGRPSLEVRPGPGDRLVLTWTSSDGARSDTAELRRLR